MTYHTPTVIGLYEVVCIKIGNVGGTTLAYLDGAFDQEGGPLAHGLRRLQEKKHTQL